ncbi:M48 family metallopeptidase [Halorarum halobium]|uniref:M48 family metallopeptidase n=1 Tax=Halorarum halobium TaxID=3075121 RepID=UPI0028AAE6BB|nr:M56 family metallopeptidase [Halobaculum sp. XH14]
MEGRSDGHRFLLAVAGVLTLFVSVALGLALWVALRYVWANRPDPITALAALAAITLVSGYLTYRFGTGSVLSGLNALALPRSRAPRLHALCDGLAESMDVETLTVYVARLGEPNALALGGRSPALVVDRSLFTLLTEPEFEAVLAHEFAHLEAADGLSQSLAYSVVHTLVGVVALAVALPAFLLRGFAAGLALLYGTPTKWKRTVPWRLRTTLEDGVVVLFVALTLLVRAYARRREFAADDRAIEVTGRPLALASALRKIEGSTGDPGPFGRRVPTTEESRALARLLSTHPSLEERIERLGSKADGQDGEGADWTRVPVEG